MAAATAVAAPAPAPTDPRLGALPAAALGVALGAALFLVLAGTPTRLPRDGQLTAVQAGFLLGWAWVEEMVWRRLLLSSVSVVAGVALGFLAATALFALAHPHGRGTHLVTGATFGGAFVATGRLGAAIASHVTYNLLVAGSQPRRCAP